MNQPIQTEILALTSHIQSLRRDIHAHPELAYEETRTAKIVSEQLTAWGVEHYCGIGKTGVVAVIHKGQSKRCVGLRADMDALPINEKNEFAHRSKHAGKMHACGHDGHTAMLLAATHYLQTYAQFDGTIVCIFQPAEEGYGGAKAMIKEGVLERFGIESLFAIHNYPNIPTGEFAMCSGAMMASSNEFDITLRGKGGHAGLAHLAIDPIPIACQVVQGFQTIISRNLKAVESGVISVTQIHAGDTTNVIPDNVNIQGTVRTFSSEATDLIAQRMQTITEQIATAFDAKADFQFTRNYPPTINDHNETEFCKNVMKQKFGANKVHVFEPTMGAEDFSYFLEKRPGCYFIIGNGGGSHRETGHGLGPCSLHNAAYDFNDQILPIGASAWVALATAWLAR